jgi:hypothetical protein
LLTNAVFEPRSDLARRNPSQRGRRVNDPHPHCQKREASKNAEAQIRPAKRDSRSRQLNANQDGDRCVDT